MTFTFTISSELSARKSFAPTVDTKSPPEVIGGTDQHRRCATRRDRGRNETDDVTVEVIGDQIVEPTQQLHVDRSPAPLKRRDRSEPPDELVTESGWQRLLMMRSERC